MNQELAEELDSREREPRMRKWKSPVRNENKVELREDTSAEVPFAGTLYVRPAMLDMPTICPASMCWMLYLKAVQTLFPNFRFKTEYINDKDGVPRFVTEQDSYEDLEIFARTEFSLEPKRTNEQDIQRQRKEEHTLNIIERRKQNVKEDLINLENAFLYGCSLLKLKEAEWITYTMQERIGCCDDKQRLEQDLMMKMQVACGHVSDMLGDRGYFNDDLHVNSPYTLITSAN